MPFVTIDGARVHFTERKGGAQPVVFLHGGFGSSSELWRGTMAKLPPEYSGFAIDNFLDSDAPPDGYNVAAFARRAAGFVRQLGMGPAILVGHSMGGVVSQLTALDHAEGVSGLVLVCTGASMTSHQLARDLLDALRAGGATAENLRAISSHWFRSAPKEFFDDYVARATAAPLEGMIATQDSLIATDLRNRLRDILVPTLVVFGAHDTGRTIAHARALVDGISNSELVTMDDSGHTPMAETPDAFDIALHKFLGRFICAPALT